MAKHVMLNGTNLKRFFKPFSIHVICFNMNCVRLSKVNKMNEWSFFVYNKGFLLKKEEEKLEEEKEKKRRRNRRE